MLVVRNVTEWPEAVKLGVARLVGAETASIVGAMRELLTDEAAFARWPPAGRLTARASAPCSVSGNGRRAPQRARRDDKISIGAALFVGAVRELLIDEAAYAEMAAGGSPYGDGYAAARISAVFGFGQRAAAGVPARSGSPCTHCQQELTAAKARLPRLIRPHWSSVSTIQSGLRRRCSNKSASASPGPQVWTSPSCPIPEVVRLEVMSLTQEGQRRSRFGHRNAVTVGSIWVNAGIFPPCGFIARAMGLAMMTAA